MFLPVSKKDLIERNISSLDFIYISGDAYVDHPTFGCALLCRLIESKGFTVGIIPQPQSLTDYKELGEPNKAFLVGSGVVDSMVNNYSVSKHKRKEDVYSEGGIAGKRPDRALTVYCKNLRKIFPDSPIIIGGIEASLRRFSHYDYWNDEVMNSILVDTTADLLIYGMGEKPVLDILTFAEKNAPLNKIKNIRGTAYLTDFENASKEVKEAILNNNKNYIILPEHNKVVSSKIDYCKAFLLQSQNTDAICGQPLIQKQTNNLYLVQNQPQFPLTEQEMDFTYSLPYERKPHPMYKKGVPAISEVEFSITSQRGCFGNCSFCAIAYHQGRHIQKRSKESIVDEAKLMTESPDFKGYIHDVGGPSANFRNPSCDQQLKNGMCKNRDCIGAKPCPNLKVSHADYLDVLRAVRKIPKIKKVFIRSGIRFDYLMMDKDNSFFNELVKYHISGQLKVAPEHVCDSVLTTMNKPSHKVYAEFCNRFYKATEKAKLNQFIVPYFISSHPNCTLKNAVELAEYLNAIHYMPEQVQDFYPTPSTLSTTMYYTELDPKTLKPIFVAKSAEDKAMQRALLQYRLKNNKGLVKKALIKAGRQDLIGYDKKCLIFPDTPMGNGGKPMRYSEYIKRKKK